jgi:alpha-glucosidase (family GH31 glycosyl hydrolase)
VHGTFGEKRQPWLYGPIAEKAATDAIRLRYALIPYIYSYERAAADGVGLVRPLTFDYPDDSHVRDDVDAWMFGDGLLVSPIVGKGQTQKDIYLPTGTWIDYFKGTVYQGGQTIHYAVDSKTWSDIPLFIREGAIIPTGPVMDFVGQDPLTELSVDVFPSASLTHFDYYDDDGKTYAYEHGAYFSQRMTAQRKSGDAVFTTEAPHGTYKPALKYYLVKIHGLNAAAVNSGSDTLKSLGSAEALQAQKGEGWATGHDRYGPVTLIQLAAGQERQITLHVAAH